MLQNKFTPYHSTFNRSSWNPFNSSQWSPREKVSFPTKHITVPMHLFYGTHDNVSDEEFLMKQLPGHAQFYPVDTYGHLDFLWAACAKQKVWDPILDILNHTFYKK